MRYKLKKARKDAGMTQKQVAEYLHVGERHYKKKASQLGKAVKPTRKRIQSHYTTNKAEVKEQIIFCCDQTCKYNNNAVCKKRELHHKIEQGNLEQGQAKVSVVCEDYEVRENA